MPKRLAPQLTLSLTVIVVIISGGWGYINVRSEQRQLLDVMVGGADQLSKGIASATWHAMLADRRCAGLRVAEIAFAAGFSDISHFNRSFRRRFGLTPTAAR